MLSKAQLKQIQLDAWKQGMTDAAEIVHKDGTVYMLMYYNAILERRKQQIHLARDAKIVYEKHNHTKTST